MEKSDATTIATFKRAMTTTYDIEFLTMALFGATH